MISPERDGLPHRLAFYLPQFHRTIENDAFYEAGFTEWTTVVNSQPHFSGHQQPFLPGELGFYDLRVSETREAQAALARDHGVTGFCYYHYWFSGERFLESPLDDVLASGTPDFPFCLLWTNHDWRLKWHASDDEVIAGLAYSEEDDREHIRWLLNVFRDPRYIRIEGRPVFGFYLPGGLPDPVRLIEIWKEESEAAGEEPPWLIAFDATHVEAPGIEDPRKLGFDASAEFFPHHLDDVISHAGSTQLSNTKYPDRIYDYDETASAFERRPDVEWIRYPCVSPAWDNSPRRPEGGSLILSGATTKRYGRWLKNSIKREAKKRGSEGIVFINAWNEWGEGAVLEPDAQHGRARLETTREVVLNLGGQIKNTEDLANPNKGDHPGARFIDLWDRSVALQRTLSGFTGTAARRENDLIKKYEPLVQQLRLENQQLLEIIQGRGLEFSPPVNPSGLNLNPFTFPDFTPVDENRYLELLKGVLTRALFLNDRPGSDSEALEKMRLSRSGGLDWPDEAETMVGLERLDHLEYCVRTVLSEGIPGDFLEAGVWRGGASIFMTAVLEVCGDRDRRVFASDSFEGLPAPDIENFPQDSSIDLSKYLELAVSLEVVQSNFERYGLLSDRVVFLKGLFKDTLPTAAVKELAILRLDGDYYESTIQALESLYDKVSPGGFVIIDDYFAFEQCKLAVTDFRSARGITSVLVPIDAISVFWRCD